MSLRRCLAVAASLIAALVAVPAALAQPDIAGIEAPGRVGRIADVQGTVWTYDDAAGAWVAADRNRPLIEGDRLSVDADARAELRIGPTVLRLGGGTELEIHVLDDERMQFGLLRGGLALRVPTGEHAAQTEVHTGEGVFVPLRAGHYRFDREDDVSYAGVWRGALQYTGPENLLQIDAGERYEIWRQGADGYARSRRSALPSDRLGAWALASDRAPSQTAAYRYVSPEMTGAEELDRHGRWIEHPEYGAVWSPYDVPSGWAPYRQGRWVWMQPWGWTWMDAMSWGFAPFHYGRWVHWHGRWAWWPGQRHARPVFSPALVAWTGGPHVSLSFSIGGPPASSWVPLAPYQPYYPVYRPRPPRHHGHPTKPPRPPHYRPPPPSRQVPTGPVSYGKNGLPSNIRQVPNEATAPRPPVSGSRPATQSPTTPVRPSTPVTTAPRPVAPAVREPVAPAAAQPVAPAAKPTTPAAKPVAPAARPVAPAVRPVGPAPVQRAPLPSSNGRAPVSTPAPSAREPAPAQFRAPARAEPARAMPPAERGGGSRADTRQRDQVR